MVVLSRRRFLQAGAAALSAGCTAEQETSALDADVCIYGATSAGVVAAVQAARMGRSAIVVEPGRHVGGMSAEGLGATDIDNHAEFQNSLAVGGLALEFYRDVSHRYGREAAFEEMLRTQAKDSRLWKFEPKVAEDVFERWLAEASVPVLREHRIAEQGGVEKEGARIVAIRCENGAVVRAKVFLDCTYEGDLLAAAGVSFEVGREGRARYGESKNGIRVNSTHRQLDRPLDAYRAPGEPASGLLFGVSGEPLGEDGAPSDAIQGFSFRLVLTAEPGNRLPFERPESYDPEHYELQRRYFAAGGEIAPPRPVLPNGKNEPGSWHRLCGFLTGWNHDWNTASYAERDRLLHLSDEYVKGLYWFLANDADVPAKLRDGWSQWGLCRDEFTDNGGWPRIFYVRNGRRMVGDFVMTEAHGRMRDPAPVDDSVGLVWWPHDLHAARRMEKDGIVWDEGAVFNEKQDWRPFGISYRSLAPRRSECTNLLTPTCPSMSYVAYGAFRVEYSFMAAAQSAATAAAMALEHGTAVQDVEYEPLRERLIADGQVLAVPTA